MDQIICVIDRQEVEMFDGAGCSIDQPMPSVVVEKNTG